MKYSGKARKAGLKLIILTFVAGVILWALMFFASILGTILSAVAVPALLVHWLVFAIFTL
jgi:Flp pilus assembly protein TadB